MDERKQAEFNESVSSEMKFLYDRKIPIFTDCSDLVVCVRSHVNQIINCFATTDQDHTLNLFRRVGAHILIFFGENRDPVVARPRDPVRSFGQAIINLDQATRRAEEALGREGRGEARSQLMNVLGVIAGAMIQFGLPSRKGYEE